MSSEPELYSPIEKTITVTVQGMICVLALLKQLMSLKLNAIDTALGQVQIGMKDFVVMLGTNNVLVDCSINITNLIGPLFNALQVSWLLNGTEQLSNTALTPHDNTEHTDSFTSTLTVEITGYDKTGNYCCIASLAGSDRDMSDCIIVTVSGICISCDAWSH